VQDLTLSVVYYDNPRIVFKGGTCLWKLFKLPRFSEDLDFASPGGENPTKGVVKKLGLLGFDIEVLKDKETGSTAFSKLRVSAEGFGSTVLRLQVGLGRGSGEERPFHSPYPDIRLFNARVPPLERVAEDKVSALMHREKPRDLYDLHFLVRRHGIRPEAPDLEELRRRIDRLEPKWKTLEPLVMDELPDFASARRDVLGATK
jgi:predicted nucleotidyltransferase component of viral defense system